jgi:16S rRNA (uracil1498-N3)-methyltransferase
LSLPTFFNSELNINDALIELSPQESQHAAKARRLKVGSAVRVLNGRGLLAEAKVHLVERSKVTLALDEIRSFASPERRVRIATAIPKGDRQKAMLDMLTQLGVSQVVPLNCEYSVTRFSANMQEKWLRVAIEACKQSQNPWLPEILPAQDVAALQSSAAKPVFYADGQGHALADLLVDADTEVTIAIGPEGGFSPAEIAHFKALGISAIRLGGHILRTETAAIAAASQWAQIYAESDY